MAKLTFFMGLLGALIAVTVVLFIIAQNLVEPNLHPDDPQVSETIRQRVEPIGRVHTDDAPIQTASRGGLISEATAAADFASGEEVYNAVCMACHTTGVLNSPKLGDKAAWKERLAKGRETLLLSVINGLNLMPAKGGRPDLSDAQIEMAVDYLLDSLN